MIELNDQGLITNIIDLQAQQVETANTLFFNGIISSEIVSMKQHLSDIEIKNSFAYHHYIDLSDQKTIPPSDNVNDQIIDFGSDNIIEINKLLKDHLNYISRLKMDQFINACCYQPQQLLKSSSQIRISNKVQLFLWEGVNLATLQINPEIRITKI